MKMSSFAQSSPDYANNIIGNDSKNLETVVIYRKDIDSTLELEYMWDKEENNKDDKTHSGLSISHYSHHTCK